MNAEAHGSAAAQPEVDVTGQEGKRGQGEQQDGSNLEVSRLHTMISSL